MNRNEFQNRFKSSGPAVFVVIHVLDSEQTARNVAVARDARAAGVFLINHDFDVAQFLPIIQETRARYPEVWLGVNFLAVTGRDAFPILGQLLDDGTRVDGYWADDARIDESRAIRDQPEAQHIASILRDGPWDGLYFGGTAFKKQREVSAEHYETSATIARQYMDVVTTSGVATGQAADAQKIAQFRRGLGDAPLGLASGVTPENVSVYAQHVDAILVATGVNVPNDFYNLDPERLGLLIQKTT